MAPPAFLFAPGAGSPSIHPWMQRWAALLREIGTVKTLDYPYMLEHRKRPDRLPRLIDAHLAALKKIQARRCTKMILIGKSMGSRIGCHVALLARVHAVVCLGYPLCAGGDPVKLRDEVLLRLTTPILFIQGTRDFLCPLNLLAKVRKKMRGPNQLEIVPDGDHSLMMTRRQIKASGQTQDELERHLLGVIQTFVH
jgi:predicted alpha/beta-hydrolase family hydrolase